MNAYTLSYFYPSHIWKDSCFILINSFNRVTLSGLHGRHVMHSLIITPSIKVRISIPTFTNEDTVAQKDTQDHVAI